MQTSATFLPSERLRFSQALVSFWTVTVALVLRETQTRFGRSRIGYLWAFIEPLMHIIGFSEVTRLMHHAAPLGNSIEIFFTTGILPFFVFRDLSFNLTPALEANRALLGFPIVHNTNVILSRILLEIATWFVVGALALAIFQLAGYDALPAHPLDLLMAWGAMILLGSGFGALSAVITMFFHNWERVVHMMIRIMYVTSGVYFLPWRLPAVAGDVIYWFPTCHGVEWFREAFFDGYKSPILERGYILLWGLTLLFAALAAERFLRKRMESE